MSVELEDFSSASELAVRIDDLAAAGAVVVPEAEAKALLRAVGIEVPAGTTVTDPATQVPEEFTGPLVLKAVSPTLVHKSDVGGVQVGLTRADLATAAERMRAAVESAGHGVDGFLVEQQAPAGVEVVVGAVRTPGLGWAVMVGLGGVFVEILGDVSFGVAPLDRAQLSGMVLGLRSAGLLSGARGRPAVALDALLDLLERVAGPGGLLAGLPDQVVEIDLNPVIVSTSGAVAVDARMVLGEPVPPTGAATDRVSLKRLLRPECVAVLGASATGRNGANLFLANLVAGGFSGRVVPVHPTAESIEGLPAVSSLAAVDGQVDYAFVALPAARVADALAAGAGKVSFAQVVSSGFGETEEGAELERELQRVTARSGIRLLGPNCLGTHSSAGGLSFVPDAPLTPGGVAVVSQSGGLSVDILRQGAAAGVDFHSVVSIGNAADLTAADLVRAHLADPEVRVIGLYLESLSAAGQVIDVLRAAGTATPVVILAGGRTPDGSRAATSHTGALAGNHRLWEAVARQPGVVLVDSLTDFVSVLSALDALDLDLLPGPDGVVLFGNGGGASVLAADALQRRGLSTPRLPDAAIAELTALGLPPGNGLNNPIDAPAGTLAVAGGAVAGTILSAVLGHCRPAAIITHLNVGIIQRNLAETHGDVTGRIIDAVAELRHTGAPVHHLLVLKSDGTAGTDQQVRDYSRRAKQAGIPAFSSFEDAALASRAILNLNQQRVTTAGRTDTDR